MYSVLYFFKDITGIWQSEAKSIQNFFKVFHPLFSNPGLLMLFVSASPVTNSYAICFCSLVSKILSLLFPFLNVHNRHLQEL